MCFAHICQCVKHILYNIFMGIELKEIKFGENFRNCRKEAKLTQEQVANYFGIKQSSVSDWENNISRPEYEKLFELAKLYNVSLCELLDYDDNNCKK